MQETLLLYAVAMGTLTVSITWRWITTRVSVLSAGKLDGLEKEQVLGSLMYKTQRLSYLIEFILSFISTGIAVLLMNVVPTLPLAVVAYIVISFILSAINYIIVERIGNKYLYSKGMKGQVK